MKSSIAVRPGVQSHQPDERSVSCPHCHGSQRINSEYMGLLFMCRNCGRTFRAHPNDEPSFKVPPAPPSFAPSGRVPAGLADANRHRVTPQEAEDRPAREQLDARMANLKADIYKQRATLLEAGIRRVQGELDARAVDHETSLRQLREAKELLARARDQRHDLRGQLERARNESRLATDWREQLAEARGEIDRLRALAGSMYARVDEASRLDEELRASRAEVDGLRAELVEARDRERDDRTSRQDSDALERELDSVRSERDRLRDEIMAGASERERFDRAIGEIDAIRAERDRLEAERQAGERREEQLRAEISEGERTLRDATSRHQEVHDQLVRELDEELRASRAEVDGLQGRGAWRRGTGNVTTGQVAMTPTPWSGSWTPCAPERDRLRDEIMAGASEREQFDRAIGERDAIRAERDRLEAERQAGERREEQLRAEISEGERTLRDATSRHQEAQEELDAARRQFERGNQSLHEEIERLRGEAEALRKGHEEASRQAGTLAQERDLALGRAAARLEELDRLTAHHDAIESAWKEARNRHQAEVARLVRELEDARQRAGSARRGHEEVSEREKRLRDELERHRRDREAERQELHRRMVALQRDLQVAQAEAADYRERADSVEVGPSRLRAAA